MQGRGREGGGPYAQAALASCAKPPLILTGNKKERKKEKGERGRDQRRAKGRGNRKNQDGTLKRRVEERERSEAGLEEVEWGAKAAPG